MRKIVVDGKKYEYMIGKQNVLIRAPGVKIVKDFSAVSNQSWTDIERGIWKRYFHITPCMIEKCVRENV